MAAYASLDTASRLSGYWATPALPWGYVPPAFLELVNQAALRAKPDRNEHQLLKLRLALRAPQLDLRPTPFLRDRLFSWAIELLEEIRIQQSPYAELIPEVVSDRIDEFELQPIPQEFATIQHRAFHYIGSPREGQHLGLVHRSRGLGSLPMYLMTFSKFDIEYAAPYIQQVLGDANVLMLARVHGFNGTPKNSFSFAFSRAVHELKWLYPSADVVLTYVNPNVGFMGASYRAANWVPFAEEQATYLYMGTRYITVREFLRHGGMLSSMRPMMEGKPVHLSHEPLLPLRLFAYPLSPHAKRELLGAEIAHGKQL